MGKLSSELQSMQQRSAVRARAIAAMLASSLLAAHFPPNALGQQPAASVSVAAPIRPSDPRTANRRAASLTQQLRVGLNAATPADLAYIDHVVSRVNAGVLPRSLVDSTFLWARNRYKSRPGSHRLRPIVYFQPALTARAKAIGITL